MFKRLLTKTVILSALVLLFISVSAFAAEITFEKGISVEFFNNSPWYVENGQWTMGKHISAADENNAFFVSLEDFSDTLGINYDYDEENQSIYIKGTHSEIWQTVGFTAMFVNKVSYEHPAPYISDDGAVMIPLEPYSSVFGFSCKWDTPEDYLSGRMTVSRKSVSYKITKIEVNKAMQMVTIYGTNPAGGVEPVKHFICSTGIESSGNGTPVGLYTAKPLSYGSSYDPWYYFSLNDCWVLYCTQILGNICFHSVPVNGFDMNMLSSSAYNNLGTAASHGCIRLLVEDAEFIWKNCLGIPVSIINGEKTDELIAIKNNIIASKLPYSEYVKLQKQAYPQTR